MAKRRRDKVGKRHQKSLRLGSSGAARDMRPLKTPVLTVKQVLMAPNVLVVGDGDFSFSRALARLHGQLTTARQLICTSFDTRAVVTRKYPSAQTHLDAINLQSSKSIGAISILHDVDATKLSVTFGAEFNRVIFNFPHIGRQRTHLNRIMVCQFFVSASKVIAARDGLILVTLKDRPPYNRWNIEQLGNDAGLTMKAKIEFNDDEFPGYAHCTTDPNATALRRTPFSTYTYIFSST